MTVGGEETPNPRREFLLDALRSARGGDVAAAATALLVAVAESRATADADLAPLGLSAAWSSGTTAVNSAAAFRFSVPRVTDAKSAGPTSSSMTCSSFSRKRLTRSSSRHRQKKRSRSQIVTLRSRTVCVATCIPTRNRSSAACSDRDDSANPPPASAGASMPSTKHIRSVRPSSMPIRRLDSGRMSS